MVAIVKIEKIASLRNGWTDNLEIFIVIPSAPMNRSRS